MLQLLPQQKEIYIPNTVAPEQVINDINSYINENVCENISIDISFMNLLDACYVSTLCSTHHYIKYPQGKINWKVPTDLVKEFNNKLSLDNAEYIL